MMRYAITPMRLCNTSGLNDRDLLSSLRRAEHGYCYASLVELLRHAVDRDLDLDADTPVQLAA